MGGRGAVVEVRIEVGGALVSEERLVVWMGWMGGRRLGRWLRLRRGGSGALYSSRILDVSVRREQERRGRQEGHYRATGQEGESKV